MLQLMQKYKLKMLGLPSEFGNARVEKPQCLQAEI